MDLTERELNIKAFLHLAEQKVYFSDNWSYFFFF